MHSLLYVFVLFFAIATVFGRHHRGDRCGKNEVYSTCHPHISCQPTCDNYQTPPKICPTVCTTGCACGPSFVRKWNGSCVKPKKCRHSH
ncbi:hypothetical protein ILUMI_12343 [Ignelater luminosus]|uniref:TIL domain-containing protein n=1 Tax=Ignelater luminosus TaxID=2038154 RepID=A0A8K0CUF1_IGNLU|nr:hypothetical protein ILUMI_12343 [Ignelater luminosus]